MQLFLYFCTLGQNSDLAVCYVTQRNIIWRVINFLPFGTHSFTLVTSDLDKIVETKNPLSRHENVYHKELQIRSTFSH